MAGAWQGCPEAQGAPKSGRGLPQSKTLRVVGGVGGRGSILEMNQGLCAARDRRLSRLMRESSLAGASADGGAIY